MRARALTATALVLLPGVAAACPTCLSTAYGDRTFNWAFLGLILMPFVLAAAIGGVLLYSYRWSRHRHVGQPHTGSPFAEPHTGSPRAGGAGPADALRLTKPPREETT